MRGPRLLSVVLAALTVAACARRQQPAYYVVDPATGRQVAMMVASPPQPAAQPMAQAPVAQAYAAPANPQPQQSAAHGRGLFTDGHSFFAPRRTYAQQPVMVQPPSVIQYGATQQQPQHYAAQPGSPYAAAPYAYGSAPAAGGAEPAYTLDAGDKLRIVVFGQDGISNTYTVDAGGNVNLPLIGTLPARGLSTQALAQAIAERLKHGYVREPHVSVEVEAYRPFFILGEVTTPGQYPYVANMTAEAAVAIAGGFGPRARKNVVELTRNTPAQRIHGDVPLSYPIRPGDTIVVKERWF